MHLNGTISTINNKIDTVFDENNAYNAIQTDTSKSPSLVDGSWKFDGVDDNFIMSFAWTQDETTASAWFKSTSSESGFIIDGRDTPGDGYFFQYDGAGNIDVNVNGVSANKEGSYNDGKWHHAVLVKNSTHIRVYVDGGGGTSVASSSNTDVTSDAKIGVRRFSSFASFFNGSIDEVMIFDRALRKAEIQELYNSCDTVGGILNCNY
jgi:hypothetical protein